MTRKRKYRRFTNRKSRAAFLEALSRGMPVIAACRAAHWYQPGVYELRKADKEFAEQWDVAIEEGIGLLEQEATRRALIGREVPIFHDGKQIGVERVASDTLLIFLLKAKRPEVYRDTHRLDITNSDQSLQHFAEAMNLLEMPNAEDLPFDIKEVTDAVILSESKLLEAPLESG